MLIRLKIRRYFELHFLLDVKQNNVCFYSKFAYPECYILRKTLGVLILGLEWKLPWCDLSRLPGGRPWTDRSSWCVPWTGRSRLGRHRWSIRCPIPKKVVTYFYFTGHQVPGNGTDAKTGVNFQSTILLAILILLYEVFTKFYLSIRISDYSMLRFGHVFLLK